MSFGQDDRLPVPDSRLSRVLEKFPRSQHQPSLKTSNHYSGGAHGLDFGLYGSGLRLLPTESGMRFSFP